MLYGKRRIKAVKRIIKRLTKKATRQDIKNFWTTYAVRSGFREWSLVCYWGGVLARLENKPREKDPSDQKLSRRIRWS